MNLKFQWIGLSCGKKSFTLVTSHQTFKTHSHLSQVPRGSCSVMYAALPLHNVLGKTLWCSKSTQLVVLLASDHLGSHARYRSIWPWRPDHFQGEKGEGEETTFYTSLKTSTRGRGFTETWSHWILILNVVEVTRFSDYPLLYLHLNLRTKGP